MLLTSPTNEAAILLRDRLGAGGDIHEPLDRILQLTEARATGLWKRNEAHLELIAFRGVASMPEAVKQGFADATCRVPLSQDGLGIVKAVLADGPAIATLQPQATGLGDSASWLERFEARSSIAVPIRREGAIVGVLAISTAESLTPDSTASRQLIRISDQIGSEVANWQTDPAA